jgi:hypothetical protein
MRRRNRRIRKLKRGIRRREEERRHYCLLGCDAVLIFTDVPEKHDASIIRAKSF